MDGLRRHLVDIVEACSVRAAWHPGWVGVLFWREVGWRPGMDGLRATSAIPGLRCHSTDQKWRQRHRSLSGAWMVQHTPAVVPSGEQLRQHAAGLTRTTAPRTCRRLGGLDCNRRNLESGRFPNLAGGTL